MGPSVRDAARMGCSEVGPGSVTDARAKRSRRSGGVPPATPSVEHDSMCGSTPASGMLVPWRALLRPVRQMFVCTQPFHAHICNCAWSTRMNSWSPGLHARGLHARHITHVDLRHCAASVCPQNVSAWAHVYYAQARPVSKQPGIEMGDMIGCRRRAETRAWIVSSWALLPV